MGQFWRNLFSCFSKEPEVVAINRVPITRNGVPALRQPLRQAEVTAGSTQNQALSPKVEVVSDSRYLSLNSTIRAFIGNHNSDGVAIFNGTFGSREVLIKRTPKSSKQAALNEANLISKIDCHENVVQFLCTVEDSKHIYIVTQRHQVSLRKHVKCLMGIKNQEVFQQLTNAADYLHRMNIIYFNFNPDDVHVLCQNEIVRIKLTNFGNSKKLQSNSLVLFVESDFKGIESFIAPEIDKHRVAGLSSDIFSLGCLFYFIMSRGQVLRQQSQMIIDRQRTAHVNASAKTCDTILGFNIMAKCLKMLPKDRMSAIVMKEDPYFWSVHEKFDLILEVTKALENGPKKLQNKLQFNKNKIIGADWKIKIGDEVSNELSKTRKYDGHHLYQLVQVIRNHYVHKSASPVLDSIIGTTKEQVMSYWMEKFPLLIPHLYEVMRT